MSKPNEERDIYYIPPNFLASGRLFGGMIRARNAIEACVLVLLTGIPIIKLPMSLTVRIIILCLLPLPLGIFGIIGFEGDSLSEFAINWVRWFIHRRSLYRSDVTIPETARKQKKRIWEQEATKPPEELGIRIKQPRKKRKRPAKTEKQLNKNNRKMVPSHKKQVTYSEDFVPVKDIRNGIIEMEDGRYIRVLEVEPINFLLRSTSEQKNIVASFASWMKISPIKIQIKVLTKKADIGKHLSTIERDMESESILDDTPQTVKVKSNEVITVEFRNQPKGGVLVKKVDAATNEPISDVEFLVTDSDGNFIGNANGKFITDSAGTFTITDIAPGTTLIIKETRAKDGYLLDDTPQTVKVKSNEMITLEFRNQPLGGLRIIKLDSVTKKPLEGVQFRITYSDGSFVADEGGKLSSNGLYMTDANGEILIRDIVGTLVVTEVKTIPGYTIDEATRSQTIVVNPDDLQTLIVYNVPAGGLQIIKSDADTGERLGGVKFEIRKINGEILGTYTTDRDGVISIPNAESGWYTIVERKAKDGYALDTTPVNACVKDSETTTVEITNQRMASIMIHKIDAATGTGIYGVKFVLYDSGKNPIGEYTTDQDGYIYIDDELVPGKYYLRELEAADGYIRDEQYKTVYVERGKCAQIEWENSAVTGQIQIRKYSSEDNTVTGQLAGTPLEGAVFEITQARSGKVVGYIVTDARGVAASGPLPLGRYFVTEVSAPKYYQLSGEKMEAEIEYPSQIIKLSAYNKPASLGVTIKKSGNYEVQSGQTMSYDFSGIANTSNVALNHFFWHDRIPTDATRALSISTGTYNARLYYKVTFKTNLNDYRTLASNLLTSNNYSLSLNAATLRLAQGEYVTDVRFEFGTVPSGFSSVVKPTMRVQVLGTVSNGYQMPERNTGDRPAEGGAGD